MNNLIALLGIFSIFFALIGIALYVLFAYSFYKMTINAGLEHPWMAWVPILQLYLLGKLIKSLKISTYQIPNVEMVLPIACLVVTALNEIAVIGSLLTLANYILILFALNKLYRMYRPDQASFYTILSIFSLPVPFIFLILKDLKPMYFAD